MTIVMKLDLVGPKARGLAVGLNGLSATSLSALQHSSRAGLPHDTGFDLYRSISGSPSSPA